MEKTVHSIGGLSVNVYSNKQDSQGVVTAFFFLHGRYGSAEQVEPTIRDLDKSLKEKGVQKDYIIVTFDQRNHGLRLVDAKGNYGWKEGVDKHNEMHALDMYAILAGATKDVSFLIDFLPSFIYPSGEKTIEQWGIIGISLGGHATWLSLVHEPRISIGIPIVGCPDYKGLMAPRAQKSSIPFAPPYVPDTLVSLINRFDPVAHPYSSKAQDNPFLEKKILVLSGGKDTLVPWTASEKFVNELEVGEGGVKEVIVEPETGHACSPTMIQAMGAFLARVVLFKNRPNIL